jgi:hypothetical protein
VVSPHWTPSVYVHSQAVPGPIERGVARRVMLEQVREVGMFGIGPEVRLNPTSPDTARLNWTPDSLKRNTKAMKNGTLNFYSTVASLIPLIFITYIFSLRVLPTITKLEEAIRKTGRFVSQGEGCIFFFINIAPFAALAMGIVGEIACLNALYTGKPSEYNSNWVIATLIVLAIAIAAHFMALGLIWIYHWQDRRRDKQA